MDASKKIYDVTVIMSTYNGEEYIQEQLDSLCCQEHVSINLVVRDDGSSDCTVNVIENYREKFNDLKIVNGENIGATASFHCAAKIANNSFNTKYYAFCDQDDIWEKDKLIRAIEKLEQLDNKKPTLYFSNLMMVNNSLKKIGMLLDDNIVSSDKQNPLSSICTYGCTCVFNDITLKKFVCLDEKNQFIYHDNWIYAVAVFLGNVFYDENSFILYRQTGNNVSGEKKKGFSLWWDRVNRLLHLSNEPRMYEAISINLLSNFNNELVDEDKKLLGLITNYRNSFIDRLKLIFTTRMYTKKFSKNICILGRIFVNRL